MAKVVCLDRDLVIIEMNLDPYHSFSVLVVAAFGILCSAPMI